LISPPALLNTLDLDLNIQEFRNEEWFKDLFDNAHDLIHIAKPEGTLLYANASWFRAMNMT
jgi:hypothetical protein